MNSVFNHYLSQYLAIYATLTKLLHPLVLYKYIKLLSFVPVCVCVFSPVTFYLLICFSLFLY